MTDNRAISLFMVAAILPGLVSIAFFYRGPLLKPVFLAATLYVERDNKSWLDELPAGPSGPAIPWYSDSFTHPNVRCYEDLMNLTPCVPILDGKTRDEWYPLCERRIVAVCDNIYPVR
jgi:hypothetical protein